MTNSAIIDNYDSLTDNGRRIQIYVMDLDYVSRSIVYLQIAAAINIFVLLGAILMQINITRISIMSYRIYDFLSIIWEFLDIVALGFILIGFGRICYFLRKEVKIIFLISAAVSFVFFSGLSCIDFIYFTNEVIRGGNSIVAYFSSELRFVLILIFLPIIVISCIAVALRVKKHFDLKPDRPIQIYLLTAAFIVISIFRIIAGFIQWLRYREIIEFPSRYNQSSQIDYIYTSIFLYPYILMMLWFVWMLIVLRLIKFSRTELPETYKKLVIN